MASVDLIIRGRNVVAGEAIAPASVHVVGGRVRALKAFDDVEAGCELYEATEKSIVMPGLVDTHVHINEPGRTEWEGFRTATRAAAAGGVTTLVEMPLNSIPPTTTLKGFGEKLSAAEGKCWVDVAFWGGVVPGNREELQRLFDAGVVGFKCFLVHSGVEEFPNVTETDLREAMKELARLGALLIVHAELPGPIENSIAEQLSADLDPRSYSTFLNSRPRRAEDEAVALVIRLSRETGARCHIVHHSSSDSLQILREAKREGVPITVETCPHYLAFSAEEIADGATEFKCCPPIRERENSEKLWAALREGLIDMVVSDHSPCPPEMKLRETGDFLQAWGGISSLELRLPVMWTLMRARDFSINDLVRLLAEAPARLVRLDKKGRIAEGFDADIVVWNPYEEFRVDSAALHHRHKLTPYAGRNLFGRVEATFLRGRKIFERGEFEENPAGMKILRGEY